MKENYDAVVGIILLICFIIGWAFLVVHFEKNKDRKTPDQIWCEENGGRWIQVYRGHNCVFPPVK